MSEEIKEILDNMKEWSVDGVLWFEIDDEKAKLLYNYITNLQEENQELRADYGNKAQVERDLLEDRIDKAISLLKRYGNGTFDENLLNILQGEDNE